MPELPEVETIKRGLEPLITGQKLADVEISWAKSFPASPDLIKQFVVGAAVKDVERRAKVLIWNLDNGYSLLFHLKMTGQMVYVKADGERLAGGHPSDSMSKPLPDNSTRAIFSFTSGDKLFFNDQRKFGWVKLEQTADVIKDPLIARLGPEPLTSEWSVERLASSVKKHARAPIKAIILDQSTVSGIGNIYADESLHLAKIHPARLGGSLTQAEIKRLHTSIRDIIAAGIAHGGTSFAHYVNSLGGKGDYLAQARVFKKDGTPCPVCGTEIIKLRVAGRGTHICPQCQSFKIS